MTSTSTIYGLIATQLFYGFFITVFVYALSPYVGAVSYGDIMQLDNLTNVNQSLNQFESSITSQTELPLTDLGSLTFYSSNIIIDLFLNVFTAIPQMITLLFEILFQFITVSTYIQLQIKITVLGAATLIYYIGLISSIMNMRAGRGLL